MRSTGLVEAALERVQAKLEQGFATIRVYVGSEPAADEAFLVGVRGSIRESDPDQSLDFSNLVGWRDALRLTERYTAIAEVMLVESVALRGDLEGLREYRQRGRLPVSEHVHGARHAWELLHRGCVDILNISPYVLGGLRATMRTAAMAEAAGVDVLIGTTQELNLGTAAVAHLGAVLPTLPYPADNTGPRLYVDDVVTGGVEYDRWRPVRAGGTGPRPGGPPRAAGPAAFRRPFHVRVRPDRGAGPHDRSLGMLLDFIERQVDMLGQAALQDLEPGRWPSLQAAARRRLRRSLGLAPFPARGALNARTVGILERGPYTIERVVFEPRPGFVVPALVYAPADHAGSLPAVVYAVGHWMRHGKNEALVQTFCGGLAQLGFVVLVMDPIGQGERGARFEDHGHLALLPLGLAQEGLMAWEHMRSLDYLLSRSDVDGARIGITGASGGGLTTMFTAAIDERIRAAASVCFVTSYARFLRVMRGLDWNGVGDLCNQVPGVIADLRDRRRRRPHLAPATAGRQRVAGPAVPGRWGP